MNVERLLSYCTPIGEDNYTKDYELQPGVVLIHHDCTGEFKSVELVQIIEADVDEPEDSPKCVCLSYHNIEDAISYAFDNFFELFDVYNRTREST